MVGKTLSLTVPLCVMIAQAAWATPQFNGANSMQLPGINDWSYNREVSTCDLQQVTRYGTYTLCWWGSPSLSLPFLPITWLIQDYNRPEASYWAFASSRGECSEQIDLPNMSYAPDSLGLGNLVTLTLGSQDSLNSTSFGLRDVPSGAREVQPERTSLAGSQAARALRRAWVKAKKQAPNSDVVLILTAHWAHETRAGTSMFNYNFGGIKGKSPDGLSCIRDAHEGSGHRVHVLVDRFRAYQSAKEGAEDYLSLLMRKYPQAIDAAERGDVTEFVSALKRGGYFTGSEADYARALSDLVIRAFELGFDALSKLTADERAAKPL